MIGNFLYWLKFNLWYFRHPPWDTGISPPELLSFIATHPARQALDMGCGTGTNLITLAQAGWQATGVDFVARAVRLALKRVRQAGVSERVRVFVGDIANLEEVGGTFDLVLDIGCYHALPQEVQAKYRDSLERLLAPGGYWLLYTRCRPESARAIGISETHIRLLTEKLKLVRREDGFDRVDIPATWLTLYNEKSIIDS
ncbi:MAG TPA: class I SAM-dependent methyltransferase [Levilinea sp.]|nr:class I SAM-dependent methyltransferase [Levilinea sp.]